MPRKKKTTASQNPHDAFVVQLFKQKDEAVSFIKGVLPAELKGKIDYDGLQLSSDSYVSAKLRKTFSDIVYDGIYNGINPVKIAFIIEHKSFIPAHHFKLQLLNYFLSVVSASYSQGNSVPALPIMIIFYHGESPWKDEPLWKAFGEIPDELKKYVPDFEYVLSDTHTLSESDIISLYDSYQLRTSVLILKTIFENLTKFEVDWEKTLRYFIENYINSETYEKINLFLYYIGSVSEEKYIIAEKILSKIKAEGGTIMTSIDKALLKSKKEGKLEGKLEGKIEGIQEGVTKGELFAKAKNSFKMMLKGSDNEFIIEVTELPEVTVRMLRALYNQFGNSAIEHVEVVDGQLAMK